MYYIFDGTYAGFLCCIFEGFERKERHIIPVTQEDYLPGLFQERRTITTNLIYSKRVTRGLCNHLDQSENLDFFRAFLSEDRQAWVATFNVIWKLFTSGKQVLSNYGDEDVLYFHQTLKKVSRESHRMKAFIRFQKSEDGMFFSVIEPDFNVLPLIADFFRKRYADQSWVIYDVKRAYGFMYNLHGISEVQLTMAEKDSMMAQHELVALDEREVLFQRLWKQYYKSTNIALRRNMKLHLQHVPKRYWKYLTEKEVI